MKPHNWIMLIVVLVVGYIVGVKYPSVVPIPGINR